MSRTVSRLRRSGARLLLVLRIFRVLLVGVLWASGVATLALWLLGVWPERGDVVVIFCSVALTLHIFFAQFIGICRWSRLVYRWKCTPQ